MSQHITIGDIKQGNKRATSNTSEKYKWGGVDIKIQEIESQIDLKKTADLYDPKYLYPDNYGCSHNIGGFVSLKKQIVFSSYSNPNVHPLTKGFLDRKYIYIQERLSQRHFHHFKILFYLLPKKLP